ncbi:dynamin-2A-like isoform X3 [Rutidosis leptorrhynchoides]|uniref:dynamin-2A-like isoform X3 n=1 Tax=Rutidosis leptorrhynchoides TaxID=125765 RepID=UPI003A98E632
MEGWEELVLLSDSMRQAATVLNDDDIDDNSSSSSGRPSTFLNVVALGNTGAGKSAVLNSLIGHPALPTGEGGATRAPICVELEKDGNLNSKSIILQIDSKSQPVSASALRRSLQDKLSKLSSKSRDEIYMKLITSTAPPLKLVDLPGVDKGNLDDSLVEYVQHNDALLMVVIPASKAQEVSKAKSLRIAKEYDREYTRTVGVISKIDHVSSDPKAVAAIEALLLGQGPHTTIDIPWVAVIGQSVSIASAQSSSDSSLENSMQAECESLKSILTGAPESKLGRLALVATLSDQISNHMKFRLPRLLSGLQGKFGSVQDELVRLGESMVSSSEGKMALALELCREFEDRFLQHIMGWEGSGWKVVASFEGNFPNRIKQIPLDRHFDFDTVKRVVLEADGYQPYLISPEKGLRFLIKTVLDMAKEPSRLCVEEVHLVLVDTVFETANAIQSLGRYPSFKREVVAIATAALEEFKNDAKIMVTALVDMERVFVPPQHFIRLVQRRMERQRREEEIKTKSSKKAVDDAEPSLLSRATSPQPGGKEPGWTVKLLKVTTKDKDVQEGPTHALKTVGAEGEITAGFLLKKSANIKGWSRRWFVLNEKTGKLGYTKRPDESHFRGVINLAECDVEEIEEHSSSKVSKKSKGEEKAPSLVFKITSKFAWKNVLKGDGDVVLKAETSADKAEWLSRLKPITGAKMGQAINKADDHPVQQSQSDDFHDPMAQKPADPDEELRWMAQEVRGYCEAVLNSLAANVPKAIVLCQVEKSKEDMLNKLYVSISSQSTSRIEELLQEDDNVKRKREKIQRQAYLLSKLTKELSIHDTHVPAASTMSNGVPAESSSSKGPTSGNDWMSAFNSAANGPTELDSRFGSNGHSRRYSDQFENGDAGSGSGSGSVSNASSRSTTPNRKPSALLGYGYRF